MKKVFVDGSAGTTGLRIVDRLSGRSDIQLMLLPDQVRKDPAARAEALAEADIAFLCLPDPAAIEAVELLEAAAAGQDQLLKKKAAETVIIDTSTAHRTAEGWTYGFPEIGGRRERIAVSKRIANPGCHASGFIALAAPLVESGLLSHKAQLSCFSLTGYSGGGKKMIADYEAEDLPELYEAPRAYGVTQQHKHLPEMAAVCGLTRPPVFVPIVAPYYSGMEVTIPLSSADIEGETGTGSLKSIIEGIYEDYYQGETFVKFVKDAGEAGFLSAASHRGLDTMELTVLGNDDRMTLVCRFDNLGKGASGAAIQNMNIVLGVCETQGLEL